MSNETLDLENMPLDQLRELAMKEVADSGQKTEGATDEFGAPVAGVTTVQEQQQQITEQHQQQQPPVEQPRDDKGRFVTQDQTVEEPEVFQYKIDLGDGAGVQVFEAPSMEELVEKLGKAQEHASRKIRELSAAQKTQQPVKQVQQPSKEEAEASEFLLSQELMSAPTAAMKRVFEQMVGMPIDEFKTSLSRVKAFEKGQTETRNAVEFVKSHPDYVKNEHNATLMENYIKTFGLEGTPENIERAFEALKSGGLLQLNADAPPAEKPVTDGGLPNVQRVQRTRAASGLSSRRSTTKSVTQGPTEDELYNMPLDQLRELALKS
jgi:hypothetical protein